MSDSTQSPSAEGLQIGDYLLGSLISVGDYSHTHEAVQTSVQREVIVTYLLPEFCENTEYREAFLADIRTKAMVEHPAISSVLEALDTPEHCLFAREKLPGDSLAQMHEHGDNLSPLDTVRTLRNLAEAYLHLNDQHIATLPLAAGDVFIDQHLNNRNGRVVNLAIAGESNPRTQVLDTRTLGGTMRDMLVPDLPGSTRVASLLDYMADKDRPQPLSWQQVHDLSDEVERQLAETATKPQITSPTMSMRKGFPTAMVVKALGGVVVLALIAWVAVTVINRKPPPVQRKLPDMVRVPAGKYQGPDGRMVKTREFWIDAHEVTIGEYEEFLKDIAALNPENRGVYQHENQPESKTSNEPDDWGNLLAAAREGGTWNNLTVDLNYPVVGVDWWDAYSYAEWKGRRLPSRDQWYVACSSGADPAKLSASGWSAVDLTEKTSHGIYGLAGNVMEWTREAILDPADFSQPKRHVICGASYLRPKHGAMAREWASSRDQRRGDIGFRTLTLTPQGE